MLRTLALLAALTLPTSAITVTTTADENDSPAGANISLREAIRDTLSPGIVDFDPSLNGSTFFLTLGEITISGTKNIDASALSNGVIIDAGQASRIFRFTSGLQTLTNLTLRNGLSSEHGGAIRVSGFADLTLNNCKLINNRAANFGGAIYITLGTLILNDTRISHNSTPANGGGLWLGSNAFCLGTRSTISHNSGFNGGGLYALDTNSISLDQCAVHDNRATSAGGGVYTSGSPFGADSTTIARNSAVSAGGGCFIADTATFKCCTIASNSTNTGGGLFFTGAFARTIRNTIVAGNKASFSPDIQDTPTPLTRQEVNFIGNNEGCSTAFPGGNPNANGDLVGTSASPLNPRLSRLAHSGGPTPSMHPLFGSPAINAAGFSFLTVDQRGFPRTTNGSLDIGAVELGPFLVVNTLIDEDDGALGLGAGNSLRECIDVATGTGDRIRFAGALNNGQIVLTNGVIPTTGKEVFLDASALPNGVTVNGNNSSRIFNVLSGSTLAAHSVHLSNGVNSGVAEASGGAALIDESHFSLVDAVITDNVASGTNRSSGGAFRAGESSVTLIDCDLQMNSVHSAPVSNVGGALYFESSLARLTRCNFNSNLIPHNGSANSAAALYSTNNSEVVVEDSSFLNNQTSTGVSNQGGAMRITGGVTKITGSTFENNRIAGVSASGGAIGYTGSTPIVLTNCTFRGNTAALDGGAIYSPGTLHLIHNTFSENTATTGAGGALYITNGAHFENCIIASNLAGSMDADISTSTATITTAGANLIGNNTGVETEFPAGPLVGTTATPLDPQFGGFGSYGGPTKTQAILSTSPAADAAIFTSNSPATDQRGESRSVGTVDDLGAYERGHILGYSIWAGENIPALLDATFTGDSDNDKNQNGIEYACGLSPTESEPDNILNAILMSNGLGGTEMHLTFPYEPDAPDLKYILGRNTDLGVFNTRYNFDSSIEAENFHPSGNVTSILDPIGKTITVIDQATSTTRGFWKLTVEEVP